MVSNGFPNVTTLGQQYNIAEKLSVILYTVEKRADFIDRQHSCTQNPRLSSCKLYCKMYASCTVDARGQSCVAIIRVLNNFSTSDYVRLLYIRCFQKPHLCFLPVDVYRCCAAVPHTTQQRYYNEAARQE